MDAKRILKYLKQLSANNSRAWFQDHKQEYDTIRADFEQGVQQAIVRIASFDPTVAHLTVKDCTYRFYRRSWKEGSAWRLLPASGAWSLHGVLWQLLVAH